MVGSREVRHLDEVDTANFLVGNSRELRSLTSASSMQQQSPRGNGSSPLSSPSRPRLLNSSIRTGSFEGLKEQADRAGAQTKNPAFAPQVESPRSNSHFYTDSADWKKMKRETNPKEKMYSSTEIDMCLRGVPEQDQQQPGSPSRASFLGARKSRMEPRAAESYGKTAAKKPYSIYTGDGNVVHSPRHCKTFEHSDSYTLSTFADRKYSMTHKSAKKMTPETPVEVKAREKVTDIMYQTPTLTNQHVITNAGTHPGEIVIGKGTPGNRPAGTTQSSGRDANFENLMKHISEPAGTEARTMATLFRARDQSSMNFMSTF